MTRTTYTGNIRPKGGRCVQRLSSLRQTSHSATALITLRSVTILLGVMASSLPSADAQSNSLFGRSRTRVRTAPPPQRMAAPAPSEPAGAATANAATAQERLDASASIAGGAPPVERGLNLAVAHDPTAQPRYTVKPRVVTPDTPVPMNPGLLAVSLIAVEPPSPRKFRVHDQVTVIVREDKRSTSDAKLQTDKKWDISTDLKNWIRLDPEGHLIPQNFTRGRPNIGFNFDNQYDGNGKTERKDSLITRITATVIDVKPNGLLVLEAKKTIRNEEDVQITTLTGSCRSEDVTPDNTVLSTQLADVAIETTSKGPAQDAATRGWLMKAFDFLKPL